MPVAASDWPGHFPNGDMVNGTWWQHPQSFGDGSPLMCTRRVWLGERWRAEVGERWRDDRHVDKFLMRS